MENENNFCGIATFFSPLAQTFPFDGWNEVLKMQSMNRFSFRILCLSICEESTNSDHLFYGPFIYILSSIAGAWRLIIINLFSCSSIRAVDQFLSIELNVKWRKLIEIHLQIIGICFECIA